MTANERLADASGSRKAVKKGAHAERGHQNGKGVTLLRPHCFAIGSFRR